MPLNHFHARSFIYVVFVSMLTFASAIAAPIGAVSRVSGDVVLDRTGAPPQSIKADDPVNVGDRLTTAKGAEVLIRFKDQSVLTLRPDSSVTLTQFKFEETGGDAFFAKLLKGALRSVSGLIGKSHPQNVKFATQTATIGIRGTDFEVVILPEDAGDARAGTYDYVHEGVTSLELANPAEGPKSIDVKPEETGLALAYPRPGESALQILKQRPAFLRGGGFDAHMMQFSSQPMRVIQRMPGR
jgi:hypothetical protein